MSPSTKNKIISACQIEDWVKAKRQRGHTIVTLNGSFDLLHPGHLGIISEAAAQGDYLLILLNSDDSIRAYKNSKRPIISLEYRLKMIAALEMVDAVSWFEELDPRVVLAKAKPDVHVNGAEYGQNCIEAEVVKQNGGKMYTVNIMPSFSTSAIIDKIQNLMG